MPNKASASSAGSHNKVFVLQRSCGYQSNGFQDPQQQIGLLGVYVSEEQAYAAVIQRQVASIEQSRGNSTMLELRKLVSAKGTSFKDRYKKMKKWIKDNESHLNSELVTFQIRECPLIPFEKVNESKLFDGIQSLQSVSWDGSLSGDEDGKGDEEEVVVNADNNDKGIKKRRILQY